MSTLLSRLVGPMQSWGTQSRFSVRDTGLEPSKSGVVGLLCAALGRPRATPVGDLARLRMGVRVDCEGRVAKDYHTTQNVLKAGGKGLFDTVVSTRFYLADAAFLVGLEGDDLDLLWKLDRALANPVWPLFLGRKAFPPSVPIRLSDGVREAESLEEALRCYPRIAKARGGLDERLRVVLESAAGETVRVDQPVSFAKRQFTQRHVTTTWIAGADIPAGMEV